MATSKGKSRSALGNNPLAKGIFSKTVHNEVSEKEKAQNKDEASLEKESIILNQESRLLEPPNNGEVESPIPQESTILNQESIIFNQESRFLAEQMTERVNLRLSIEINDWLNDLLKQGKRKHGRKIPKETWVQAALELFRALPVDWEAIRSEEDLRLALLNIESIINKTGSL